MMSFSTPGEKAWTMTATAVHLRMSAEILLRKPARKGFTLTTKAALSTQSTVDALRWMMQ